MDLWDEITRDDLDGDIRDVADALGVDATKALLVMFSGGTLYVPKVESVVRAIRDRRIYQASNGENFRELALTYQLTTRQIRVIVREQRARHPKIKEQELDLFEDYENLRKNAGSTGEDKTG